MSQITSFYSYLKMMKLLLLLLLAMANNIDIVTDGRLYRFTIIRYIEALRLIFFIYSKCFHKLRIFK